MNQLIDNFRISTEYTSVNFHNEETEINHKNSWDGSLPHYGLFHRTMNFLSSLGFKVGKDPRIEKDYKCLSKDHRYGKKGDLEFKAKRYLTGFKIEFFQNVVHENPYGGEYDFDEYEKMPYLIKKQFLLTCSKLRQFFLNLGYADHSETEAKTAVDIIKKDSVESFHHAPEDMNFNLSDYDGLTSTCYDEKYYDQNKKLLHNGEVKYFRDYNGYLCRGKIYHRLNMMFWIIVNDKKTAIRADYELFDLTPDEPRCRVAKERVPKEYTEKVRFLEDLTEKDLLRELRKRRLNCGLGITGEAGKIADCIKKHTDAPAADVEPVVHAHYIVDFLGDSSCSHCGEKFLDSTCKRCPNCGAHMDEPEDTTDA